MIWTEWHWYGNASGGQGSSLDRTGVIIFGVEEGLLAWSREYMIDVTD